MVLGRQVMVGGTAERACSHCHSTLSVHFGGVNFVPRSSVPPRSRQLRRRRRNGSGTFQGLKVSTNIPFTLHLNHSSLPLGQAVTAALRFTFICLASCSPANQ